MSRTSTVIMVFITLIYASDGLRPELCQSPPREKHCLIEYMVRYRWPHQIRYVYSWYMKSCFEVRWSDHCPPVPVPTTTNNFPTERDCLLECSGWA